MVTVTVAPPGFRLIEAFVLRKPDRGQKTTFWTMAVLAFRIGRPNDDVIPITALGDAGEKPWALVHPDGTCTNAGDGFDSVDDWKRDRGFEA